MLHTLTLFMPCRHGKEWEKKALANKMKKSGGTAEANRYLVAQLSAFCVMHESVLAFVAVVADLDF